MATAVIQIQVRRDTQANWDNENPVLLSGEIGFVTDENLFFIGDGVTDYQNIGSKLYLNIDDIVTIIDGKVSTETTDRMAADLVLTTAIYNEQTARIIAESILSSIITNETLNREAADIILQSNIDTETGIRDAADIVLQSNIDAKQDEIVATTVADYFRGDKTFQPLDKSAVGLSNVDNTSDVSKPVSTAQQTAINKLRDLFYYRRPLSYHTPTLTALHQSVATSANIIFFVPFIVIDTMTITDIGYNVSATGTTTLARCGIYSSDANNQPSILLADSGNLGVTLGSKSVTLASPIVLTSGLYWTAYLQNGTGSVTGGNATSIVNIFGNSTIATTAINAYSKAVTYGALPNPISSLTNSSGAVPFAYFKIT
jgi:Major tropism determinant N-terminal domain